MKMIKLFGVLMVLACLFAGSALADEIQLKSQNSPMMPEYIAHSGDVICGKDIAGHQTIYVNGSGNVELTLKEVTILPGGYMVLEKQSDTTSITLKLEGDNRIPFLGSTLPLTITGNGSLNCTQGRENAGLSVAGDLTIENGTITAEGAIYGIVTEKGNVYIEGGSLTALSRKERYGFGAVMWVGSLGYTPSLYDRYDKIIRLGSGNWKIEAGNDAASAQIVSNYSGETYLHIEKLPAQDTEKLPAQDTPPKTGDGANLVLWTALVAVSAIGMSMMLRKKKEA